MKKLPILLIVFVVIVASYFLYFKDILNKFISQQDSIDAETVEGYPRIIYREGPFEKQRKIFQTFAELNSFLNEIDPTGLTETPNIDFNKYYAIVVTEENEIESGHSVEIDNLTINKEAKELNVLVVKNDLDKECVTVEEKYVPIDIKVIEKTDYEITFEKVIKTLDCELDETPEQAR